MSEGNTHKLLSPHLSAICIHKALQFHVKGKYSHTIIAHLSAICIHIAVQFYFKRKYSLAIIATYVSHLYSNSGPIPRQRKNTHFLLSPHMSAVRIHIAVQLHVRGKYSHPIIATPVSHLYSHSCAIAHQREKLTCYYCHICQASVST